ncbi:hypothetical protein DAEQUDRAFT_224801 [Daedalea quercina L-15889]|uniref:Uncharacterized protein n=1 Tax=Daedalea quercina L-15889 TaxID=1314783 RepID=A0A165QZC9_9APHY|nr:hypothetical protein DAEQUDRAFT_224801 [Daedalea quercina L-15889]
MSSRKAAPVCTSSPSLAQQSLRRQPIPRPARRSSRSPLDEGPFLAIVVASAQIICSRLTVVSSPAFEIPSMRMGHRSPSLHPSSGITLKSAAVARYPSVEPLQVLIPPTASTAARNLVDARYRDLDTIALVHGGQRPLVDGLWPEVTLERHRSSRSRSVHCKYLMTVHLALCARCVTFDFSRT